MQSHSPIAMNVAIVARLPKAETAMVTMALAVLRHRGQEMLLL